MDELKDRLYDKCTVKLDDTHFISCKFIGCKLVYHGGESPLFDGCEFDGETQIKFTDDAFHTHRCMAELYNHLGETGKNFVENLFDSIRKNIPPTG